MDDEEIAKIWAEAAEVSEREMVAAKELDLRGTRWRLPSLFLNVAAFVITFGGASFGIPVMLSFVVLQVPALICSFVWITYEWRSTRAWNRAAKVYGVALERIIAAHTE